MSFDLLFPCMKLYSSVILPASSPIANTSASREKAIAVNLAGLLMSWLWLVSVLTVIKALPVIYASLPSLNAIFVTSKSTSLICLMVLVT